MKPETLLQIQIVEYLSFIAEKNDFIFFSIPNEGEKTAEIMTEYCKKGKKILIIGRLNQQRWDDQDGKKRSKNIINVSEFQFMDGKNDESSGTDSPPPPNDDEVPL